jgi:hypothetical protein
MRSGAYVQDAADSSHERTLWYSLEWKIIEKEG